MDLVLPEHRQRVTDVYIGQFRQRQPTSYLEFPFFAKSGKVIWFAQNASLVIENGRVAGFHIIARDITERKRAEEALRASEDRYRSVFEGAGEGILVADIESKQFMYANPAICRILGYAAEELTRLGVADIHPREALDQVVAEFEAQARGEKILSAELPCLRKDGSVIYVDITTAILVIDGRKCNVGFFTDVTKRKQAEEALRESERAARQLANENAVMAEIGRIIGSTLNIHEVYERFAEEMRKLIHFDRISVNLINPGEKTFTIPYTTGTHVPDRESGDVIPLAGTRAEWVRQNRSSLLIMKANRSKAMRDFPGLLPVFEAGIRSTMSVPLMSEGQVIGVLNLQSMAENAYRPTDVKLAERVSAQIAEAIANAQLFSERNRAAEALRESAQAAQHLAQENAVMAEVGRIISSTLNTDEVYELFAAEVRKLIPCDKMSINLVDHGKGRVTLAYVTGMPVPGRNARDSFPLAGSLTGEGIRTSGGIFYHPQSADEVAGRYPGLLPVFQSGLQSMMIVPVISKDQAIAALQFMTGRPNAYTEDHLRLGLKVANQIAGAIANAQLFLERKRAEEALREREERYRTILETMEEGYYEVDLQGRFTLFNEALSNMHGFSKEEMLGMPYKKYMSTEMAQKVYKVFNGVYKTGQPLKLSEWEIIRADGEKVFMEASVYLVKNAQGEKIGFRGIERDITVRKQMEEQLKRSEEHFRSLIESSSDIITRIDSQQNIRYASPSVERVLGYKPEDYIGQNLFHFIHPDDLKSTIAALTQGLQNAGVAISIEHRVKHKNGSWLFFQTIGKGLLDDFGNRLVVASSRDVTERKNLESQLVQAQKLESIGQLAAGIAHEINTPTQYVGDNTRFFQEAFNDLLRLIGKYEHLSQAVKTGAPLDGGLQEIDAIAKEIDLDYLTGEVPKAIQQTLEGVERVRNIVQAMKEFSHPGTKEKTPINLNKAIQNTITVARNEWKYVAEMATDFDSSLPLVSGLPGELNQVILNLIINAAHAIADVVGDGSKGKGTITVSTRLDGNWAEIRVSDTGTGIPENIRSRIFDPFFTTKKVGKGTGQGLTISHSVIVDKHGGTIHFDTAMGKGTTFITRLPIGDTVGS